MLANIQWAVWFTGRTIAQFRKEYYSYLWIKDFCSEGFSAGITTEGFWSRSVTAGFGSSGLLSLCFRSAGL